MSTLEENIEDAEFNIAELQEDARRWTQRKLDFQAIADDLSQPIHRREKFADYAKWAEEKAEDAKWSEHREQKHLESLVIELRSEKAEREAEFNRITGVGPTDIPSIYMRSRA